MLQRHLVTALNTAGVRRLQRILEGCFHTGNAGFFLGPTLFPNRMAQLRELLFEVAFVRVPETGRKMMHGDRAADEVGDALLTQPTSSVMISRMFGAPRGGT